MSSSKDKEENNHEFEEFEAYYHTGYLFEIVRQLSKKLENAPEDEQRYLAILCTVTAVMACEAFVNELLLIAADQYSSLPKPLRQLGLSLLSNKINKIGPETKYAKVWKAMMHKLESAKSYEGFKNLIHLRNAMVHSKAYKVVWNQNDNPSISPKPLEDLLKKLKDKKIYAPVSQPPYNKYHTKGGLTHAAVTVDPSRSWLWSLQPKELVEWALKTANDTVNETINLLPNEAREKVRKVLLEPKTPSPHIRTKAHSVVIQRPKPDS